MPAGQQSRKDVLVGVEAVPEADEFQADEGQRYTAFQP
jgi:hypothetical protein